MKILAILNNLNKTNRRADLTSFGGNNNKFNPSFDGRTLEYHSENTRYYGSDGRMNVVIDDYHHARSEEFSYGLMGGSISYYNALHYGAESALRNHPDLPKKHKIEKCYSYFDANTKPARLYIADPGERITDSIREDHAIVVHNYDRKRY